MEYELKSKELTVHISDLGGELQQVTGVDGTEYLWNGDPAFWSGHAPNLFPYVGRLREKQYTVYGETYTMGIHGFVKNATLACERTDTTHLELLLSENEETLSQYPFCFSYRICYKLDGRTLKITYRVKNDDDKTMWFGIGGHPAFRVPMEAGKAFEDYYVEFVGQQGTPMRVGFASDCLTSGEDTPFPLKDGNKMPLTHEMFDDEAIFLYDAAKQVVLRSDGARRVTLCYPDMKYVGFWQTQFKPTPFVCIEPWSSLPSRHGITEDLATQPGLIALEPDEEKTFSCEITFD